MKFTADIGLDLLCILCAGLSVLIASGLYSLAMGWIG